MGCFKKVNAFLVFSMCFHKTVHNNWCLDKIIGQIENDLEHSFVKHWLNSVYIFDPNIRRRSEMQMSFLNNRI